MKLKFTNLVNNLKNKKATMKKKIEEIKQKKKQKNIIIEHAFYNSDTEFSKEFGSLSSDEDIELFQQQFTISVDNSDNDYSDEDIELSN